MRTLESWLELVGKKFPNLDINPKNINEQTLSGFGIALKPYESALFIYRDSYGRGQEGNILSVLTDYAMYLYDGTQISISDLASFVLYPSPIGKSEVLLFSEDRDYNISGPMGRTSMSIVSELARFVEEFQIYYRREHRECQERFLRILRVRLALCRTSFHENGLLSEEGHYLLQLASQYPELRKEATILSLEECYRLGDSNLYQREWLEMKSALPEDISEHLRYPDEVFADRFIDDLSNEYELFITQHLIRTYQNLRINSSRTKMQQLEYLYLMIRMDDWGNFYQLLNDIAGMFSESEIQRLFAFRARFQNERMSRIYSDLVDHKRISYAALNWRDSLGFTPLHYAILLREEDVVRELLEQSNWNISSIESEVEEDVRQVLDYVFLAMHLFPNQEIAREIFLASSHTAKSLLRSLRSLEFHIEMSRKSSKLLFDELRRLREQKDENKLRDVRNKIDEIAERVEQLTTSKVEIEQGLNHLVNERMEQCRNHAKTMIRSGSPLARYLLRIALNPEILYENLFSTMDSCFVYRDGNFTFVTTQDTELPYSYYKIEHRKIVDAFVRPEEQGYHWDSSEKAFFEELLRKSEEQAKKKRRMEEEERRSHKSNQAETEQEQLLSRWFSARAMSDPKVLRMEYLALVKQYHPDENQEDTTTIMQEIQEEKESIRQQLMGSM